MNESISRGPGHSDAAFVRSGIHAPDFARKKKDQKRIYNNILYIIYPIENTRGIILKELVRQFHGKQVRDLYN